MEILLRTVNAQGLPLKRFSQKGTVRLLSCLVALFAAIYSSRAETPPIIGVQLYAGITVTGTVGAVYSIQYVTDLSQTNGWIVLTNVTLTHSPYLWVDTTQPARTTRFYRAVSVAPPNLVWIAPGSFMLGSPSNELDRAANEGPQTAVTLTRGFFLGKYLVTQGEYFAVVGNNPSSFPGQTNRPVETVSWYDAMNFCAKRTQQDLAAGRISAGSHYRLPTEAEWEYACRAGTVTRFYYGDDPAYTSLTNYAWYAADSGNITHPVGQKLANPAGLFDLAGNVWEWCQDWYAPAYPGGRITDPSGPSSGSTRVLRGGSWFSFAWYCRSATRSFADPASRFSVTGFRVVLDPGT